MKQSIIKSHKDRGLKKATDGRYLNESGVYGPSYFMNQVFVSLKKKPGKKEATEKPEAKAEQPAESITLLLAQNADMSAATFYNLLKSKGYLISPPEAKSGEKKEADMASSFPQALRAQESKTLTVRTRHFLEAQTDVLPNKGGSTRYKVVLLEEGMGNFGASAYYSRPALESAISIFEGKKIYADHPAESEASERPERSVRDILGHFENVHVESSEGGRSQLCGDVVVMGGSSYQWARELMEHAVAFAKKFPDKEFVGLSINAAGDSEEMSLDDVVKMGIPDEAMPKIQEAKKQGITTLTYVSAFTEAVSCDLVTEAGAGGKILALIEGEKMKKKKVTESQDKEAMEKQEAVDKKDEAQVGADGHADADQDMELIKKMIGKYAGGDAQPSDEECAIVKEAYEAHKEMGCKDEEAESKAVGFLQASKHMAAKREAAKQEASKDAPAGSKSGEDDKEDEQTESKGDESKESGDDKKESSVKKESAAPAKSEIEKLREENARLTGEIAHFREGDKKKSVAAHVEKLCKESKLTQTVTASFKKLVETAKSVEEVDKTWAVFQEGYRSKKSGAADGSIDFGGMVVDVEKSIYTESAGGPGINFGECVTE